MEVWQAFGGRSEFLRAPHALGLRVRLAILARHQVEAEQSATAEADRRKWEADMRAQSQAQAQS